MAATAHRSLVLIMVREFASNVATPVFLVDADGTLVFYNEPAEALLGQRYSEAGELRAGEWGTRWSPEDLDGTPLALETIPLIVAVTQHRPAHRAMRITALEGAKRTIEVTAFPLFAKSDEFVGAVAIFWEDRADAGG